MPPIARRLLVVTLAAGTAFAGFTNPSIAAPDHTPPGPVKAITAKAFQHRVALTWKNPKSPDLAKVVIRRSVGTVAPKTLNSGSLVKRVKKPVHRVNDTRVLPATTYAYAFFTIDAHHNVGNRKVKIVTTARDATVPGAVSNLTGTTDETSATLAWTNPTDSDFDHLLVARRIGAVAPSSPGDGSIAADLDKTIETFTDSGLHHSTDYSYAVFAIDTSGNASRATTRLTTDPDHTAPDPVTINAVQRGDHSIKLTWTLPSDDDPLAVTVVRQQGLTPPQNVGDGVRVDLSGPATSYTDTALPADTSYAYTVFTTDPAGNTSAVSQKNSRLTGTVQDTTPPLPVRSLTGQHSESRVSLTWSNPVDPERSAVYVFRARGDTPPASIDEGELLAVLPPDATTFVDDSVAIVGTAYSYSVFTVDHDSNVSVRRSVTAPDKFAPAPLILSTVHFADGVDVTFGWESPHEADVATIVIRRNYGTTPPPTSNDGLLIAELDLRTGPMPTSFTDHNLELGGNYAYSFFVTDTSGNVNQPYTLRFTV